LYLPVIFMVLISAKGWVDPRAIVRMEKSSDFIGNRTRDLPRVTVPQPTTLSHAPSVTRKYQKQSTEWNSGSELWIALPYAWSSHSIQFWCMKWSEEWFIDSLFPWKLRNLLTESLQLGAKFFVLLKDSLVHLIRQIKRPIQNQSFVVPIPSNAAMGRPNCLNTLTGS
jgi:hypothetical protein